MSGDRKVKKENSNQGEEFFYKLSFNKEFQQDLVRARQQLGLPKVGFTKKEARKIWIDNNSQKMLDFLGIQMHLKKKYKIPASFWWELTDDYIFFNKLYLYKNKGFPPALIDWQSHMAKKLKQENIEEFYQELEEPYVKVLFLGNINKTAAINFIDKNWDAIKESLDDQRGYKLSRTRKATYKERNLFISKLWRKSIKALRDDASDKFGKTKESLIRKILQMKGHGKVAEGYIRKISNQR